MANVSWIRLRNAREHSINVNYVFGICLMWGRGRGKTESNVLKYKLVLPSKHIHTYVTGSDSLIRKLYFSSFDWSDRKQTYSLCILATVVFLWHWEMDRMQGHVCVSVCLHVWIMDCEYICVSWQFNLLKSPNLEFGTTQQSFQIHKVMLRGQTFKPAKVYFQFLQNCQAEICIK